MITEVPSPIDLRLMPDALEWEATALSKRPCRQEFFAEFATSLAASPVPIHRVLELGSGPGFLAEHLLSALPLVSYVALDFSPAMHALAARRLAPHVSRVQFIERSFRDEGWSQDLGLFDAIVTNQAVHELRHKHYAQELHLQARKLLSPGGIYLVCDHFAGEGGMKNDQLFMSVIEHREALVGAGFTNVRQLLVKGGMVLHHAS